MELGHFGGDKKEEIAAQSLQGLAGLESKPPWTDCGEAVPGGYLLGGELQDPFHSLPSLRMAVLGHLHSPPVQN